MASPYISATFNLPILSSHPLLIRKDHHQLNSDGLRQRAQDYTELEPNENNKE
ncbi:hypothetical protein [Staphylococcus sp. GDY8P119P]|uniref:hypothetical protein n=1 Tax=Staphylococcus sp. GDY8P119P TaxID=2804155 RepID=UPI001AEC5CD7|nr:hypothetical protein [Staphylococcus sp. GDY8P119P]